MKSWLAPVTRLIGFTFIVGFFVLSTFNFEQALSASREKYGPQATRLYDNHAFIIQSQALDYWALSPYYLSQSTGQTCILASFTMVLNALRVNEKLTASDQLITEALLLKKLSSEGPGKRFYVEKGKSISLQEMADLFKKASKEVLHKSLKVDVIHADSTDLKTQKKIEALLTLNEGSAKNFIVANFLQSAFTGDPEGAVGHVAPVGAYDVKKKSVLILDPDREDYEPYWVSLETFVKGLNTLDSDSGKNRGILFIHE